MRPIYSLPLLLALSACAMSVKELREKNPAADDFPSALASEYQGYADSEYEQGRLMSAEHFASKGLDSLKGGNVEPETPDSGLAADQQQALGEARAQLAKLLNDDMKRVNPQKLARAQLLYDCWQNEVPRKLSQLKAPCQGEFNSTVAELQEVSDAIQFGMEKTYVVVFQPKSVALDEQALATVKDVAGRVAALPRYRVMLVTYTGKRPAQRHIVERRLSSVRRALVKAGVGGKNIRVKKHGGSTVVILSRDNIAVDTKKITIIVKTHETRKEL